MKTEINTHETLGQAVNALKLSLSHSDIIVVHSSSFYDKHEEKYVTIVCYYN